MINQCHRWLGDLPYEKYHDQSDSTHTREGSIYIIHGKFFNDINVRETEEAIWNGHSRDTDNIGHKIENEKKNTNQTNNK